MRRWYTWGGATLGALTAITPTVYHAENDPGADMGSAIAPAVALAGLAGAGGGYFAGAWLYSVLYER